MAVETKSQPFIGPACAEGMVVLPVTDEEKAAAPGAGPLALPDRLTMAAFAGFVLIVGSAPLALRFVYSEVPAYWAGFMRFGLGALIFWAFALVKRAPLPHGKALSGAVLYGALGVGAAFLLLGWGLIKTPAGVTSTIMSMVPLLTIFFASFHGIETLRLRGVIGGLIAVVGIAAITGSSLYNGTQLSIPHLIAILAGSACIAELGIIAKLIPPSHPLAINAIAMTAGSLIMLAGSFMIGETPALPVSSGVWLAFLYLATLGTVGTFGLYLFTLSRWTASGASYAFVLSPIVAVLLATTLAGEEISLLLLLGGLLVLLGVYVGALSGNGMRGKASAPKMERIESQTGDD